MQVPPGKIVIPTRAEGKILFQEQATGKIVADVNAHEVGLMISNWSGTFTPAQLANIPPASLISVGNMRTAKPVSGVTTLFASQICLGLYNGAPGGPPGTFGYDVNAELLTKDYDQILLSKVGGGTELGRWVTFTDGNTTTYALDLGNPSRGEEIALWFAAKLAQYMGPFEGWHNDYWTSVRWTQYLNPAYLDAAGGDPYWDLYQTNISLCGHELRRLRQLQGKSTFILGDHQDNIRGEQDMFELTGRFVEDNPDRWVTNTLGAGGYHSWADYHQAEFDEFATFNRYSGAPRPQHVLEMNPTHIFSQQYVEDVITFCKKNDCYISWGKDALAGVDWPL